MRIGQLPRALTLDQYDKLAIENSEGNTLRVFAADILSYVRMLITGVTTPIKDTGAGSAGTADKLSRADHSHPLNVDDSIIPSADSSTGAAGSSDYYARADHVHPAPALHLTGTITALPATLTNASITAAMRVIECTWGTPSAITSDITWTTSAGSIVLSGTMSGSTTVDIILIETT